MKVNRKLFFLIILIFFVGFKSNAQCPSNAADLADGFTVASGVTCNVDVGGGIDITGTVTVDDGGTLNITNGYADVVGGALNINGNYNSNSTIITWVYSGGYGKCWEYWGHGYGGI